MAPKTQASSRHSHSALSASHNIRATNLARHAGKCGVCNHPSRAAIEFDFLNWRNPFDLVKNYHLRNLSTIYRHAHATGLFSRRRLNLRFALERIVERVAEVPVTASAVIRSVRAITRINDAGEWVDPPARVIISREDSEPARQSRRKSRRAARRCAPAAAPIFEPVLLEEQEAEQPEQPAARAGEKRPAPPETIEIALSPELAAARAARQRSLEAKYPHLAVPEAELAAAHVRQSLIANDMRSPEEPND